MGVPDINTRLGGSMATALKVVVLALAFAAIASAAGVAVGIDNADLKEAMAEAEDTDSALEWTRKHLRNWGGDFKKILKKMPPLALKDAGINLAGARDLMGHSVSESRMASNKELQILAKAENRLAAAKQDVHEAQTASSAVRRAQLEDLAEELTHEAVRRLEDTKEVE